MKCIVYWYISSWINGDSKLFCKVFFFLSFFFFLRVTNYNIRVSLLYREKFTCFSNRFIFPRTFHQPIQYFPKTFARLLYFSQHSHESLTSATIPRSFKLRSETNLDLVKILVRASFLSNQWFYLFFFIKANICLSKLHLVV